MASQRTIEVWADWHGLEKPVLIGVLTATPVRGREVFAFSYDAAWLQRDQARVLDPALQLFSGPQYPPADKNNFGLFLDSSPDRWGSPARKWSRWNLRFERPIVREYARLWQEASTSNCRTSSRSATWVACWPVAGCLTAATRATRNATGRHLDLCSAPGR